MANNVLKSSKASFVNPMRYITRATKSKRSSHMVGGGGGESVEQEEEEIRVGYPTGMNHKTHMEKDPRATWGISGLPEEWKEVLRKQNVPIEKIKQADTNKVITALAFYTKGQQNDRIPLLSENELAARMKKTAQIVKLNPETKYEKLEKIGEGAGGVVYRIRRKDTHKVLAVKISPIDELKYIQSEIAYHALSEHNNIVNYHETFLWKKDVWIVMDFVDGGCLTDILGNDNPEEWTERFIAYVLRECLQALAFMHAQHLLHRDIKSDNVLVGRNGSVKLADFGFAVGLSKEKERRKSTVGTPFWMAPEVIEGIEYDERCDIWSLGITAIELVNHEPPHMDKTHVEALLDILVSPPPKPHNVDVCSDLFLDFLDKSLQKDFNKRAFATELLAHEFLKRAASTEQFAGWVVFVLDEKAKQHQNDDDSDE